MGLLGREDARGAAAASDDSEDSVKWEDFFGELFWGSRWKHWTGWVLFAPITPRRLTVTCFRRRTDNERVPVFAAGGQNSVSGAKRVRELFPLSRVSAR